MRTALPADRLAPAVGLLSGMIGLGAGAALVVGGLVVEAFGWRGLFALGGVLIVIATVLVAVAVPTIAVPAVTRRTDVAGIVLLSAGLVGVLLAVSQGATWGWTSLATITVGLAGIVLLVALVIVEQRHSPPLVDVRTFRHGPLVAVSILTLAVGFVPYIRYVALPVLLQGSAERGEGVGVTVTVSALLMLPSAVMVFLGGRFSPALVRRLGAGVTAAIAAALMRLGAAGLALWPQSATGIAVAFSVLGLGNGIGYAVCAQLVVAFSPADETAAAIGLNTVVRTIGSSAAAPVVAALLASAGALSVGAFSVPFWVAGAVSAVGVLVAIPLMARR